ncbi:ABC transporter substrate binding protein [Nisaea sp.]|uniref:ABC transporter substrate-binding protein n=1 Tax=Nisaea sp. TaxID=2024842 RepID=UPI0032EC53B1
MFLKRLAATTAAILMASTAYATDFAGKKVLFIDSYHEGYPWSDGITTGIQNVIGKSGAELKIHRMDTKRNGSDDFKKQAALDSKALIEEWNPDVVIATDDNASKYLIVPFYKGSDLPFVFGGVNWDASEYGFPTSNVTGIVEVDSMDETAELLRPLAKGDRLAMLATDNLTNRKTAKYAVEQMGLKLDAFFPKNYEEWKRDFLKIQDNYDMVLFRSPAGLEGYETDAAKAFVLENSQIPGGANQMITANFAVVTYAKVAEEQGEWAANAALEILGGKSPADIPVGRNEQGRLVLNGPLIEKLQLEIGADLISSAEQIIE